MHRLWWVAPATLAIASSRAAAEPTQIGGWFGPRLFSSSSRLGYLDDATAHADLQNGIAFGGRVARPFLPWLVPELELALVPTSTNGVGGARGASVLWFEPRLHIRFELWPDRELQPFVVAGGGAPVVLLGSSRTYGSSITGDGYVGGGVRYATQKGFDLRFDARIALLPSAPGAGFAITPELDFGIGLEFRIGDHQAAGGDRERIARTPAPDRDGDGIPDDQDACPDRPEDIDGFEDSDGCPDIDNDLDRVLDIADKCPNVPETYNGYEDDDGCPDTVPPDVDALRGTIEGLIYAEAETIVRDAALPSIRKIARTMLAHPSIRVVLVGHTDDREARQLATGGAEQPADLDALSAELSRARAEAVKNALLASGIPSTRVVVDGKGGEEPVADNAKPRGRLANRRVEIKLYVPPR
jgi:outer membrane protein OmpA-like peptidoglycan-associated protein